MTDSAARVLMEDLFPICRSITGAGVRETFDRIQREIPLERVRLATGRPLFDWTVPQEWALREAYVADADGRRLIDTADSNLHVVNYSEPFRGRLSGASLRSHLHSLPAEPSRIPYRTSYYNRTWGFCATHETVAGIDEGGEYDVVVDTDLGDGALDLAEVVVGDGAAGDVVITTHCCHPSLANDNLSGIAVLTEIAKHLLGRTGLRHRYRLVLIPGTIGSLAWLSLNRESLGRVRHGLVLTGLGDQSGFTYKQSRRGDATIDRLVAAVLRDQPNSRTIAFSPYGYDERQFCSPGFDLPFGRLTRGVHGEYPEYHTSADDLAFVDDGQLAASIDVMLEIIDGIEANRRYVNLSPYGEPQLGRRGLYSKTGGAVNQKSVEMGYLWMLNASDGATDVVTVATRSGLAIADLHAAAERLEAVDLLRPVDEPVID